MRSVHGFSSLQTVTRSTPHAQIMFIKMPLDFYLTQLLGAGLDNKSGYIILVILSKPLKRTSHVPIKLFDRIIRVVHRLGGGGM